MGSSSERLVPRPAAVTRPSRQDPVFSLEKLGTCQVHDMYVWSGIVLDGG
jgi:hypothetical protein